MCKSGVYYKGTKRTLKTLGVRERAGKEGTHLEGGTFSSKLGFRLHWRRSGSPHWVAENFYMLGWVRGRPLFLGRKCPPRVHAGGCWWMETQKEWFWC